MKKIAILVAFCVIGAAFVAKETLAARAAQHREAVRTELAAFHFEPYAAQKVVYHITTEGGPSNRDYLARLGTLSNHLKAVGASNIDLRVVLQGPGVRLLDEAKTDSVLQTRVDDLRASGVHFLVCKNSLLDQDLAPSELYKVPTSDVIQSAVAELAALQARGYVYIRM